jgi:hypothetical protein
MKKSDGNGETGSALILALLVMVILSIFSMVAANGTIQGLSFTKVFSNRMESLHASEGGAGYGYGVVLRAIGNGGRIAAVDLGDADITIDRTDTDADLITDLEDEIAGTSIDSDLANPVDSSLDAVPDVIVPVGDGDINLDIDFVRTKKTAGASSEFASRYRGIGSGSAGGFASYYRIDATGGAGTDAQSTVRLHYKCVEGGGRCL